MVSNRFTFDYFIESIRWVDMHRSIGRRVHDSGICGGVRDDGVVTWFTIPLGN
jgi:hypothetical protein